MKVAVFDQGSGKIESVVSCPQSVAAMQADVGQGWVDVTGTEVGDNTHYILGGRAVEKAPFPFSKEVSGTTLVLGGLPSGTEVRVDTFVTLADAEATEIDFEIPGEYEVLLSGSAAHLDEVLEVVIDG